MAFDYKKEYKEFYMPKNKPSIISVPKMNYIAVRGSGDPNAEDDFKWVVAEATEKKKQGNYSDTAGCQPLNIAYYSLPYRLVYIDMMLLCCPDI